MTATTAAYWLLCAGVCLLVYSIEDTRSQIEGMRAARDADDMLRVVRTGPSSTVEDGPEEPTHD